MRWILLHSAKPPLPLLTKIECLMECNTTLSLNNDHFMLVVTVVEVKSSEPVYLHSLAKSRIKNKSVL